MAAPIGVMVYVTIQPVLEWDEVHKKHVFSGKYERINPSARASYSEDGVKTYVPWTPADLRSRHLSGETRQDRRRKMQKV